MAEENITENVTEEKSCDKKKCCIFGKIKRFIKWKLSIAEHFMLPVLLLIARIHMALIFWKSGQTKIDNLDNTTMLFEWEYIPAWEKNATKTIFGTEINFPIPNAELASTMSTYTELAMPVLLVLGLMGRVGAFVLFGMAATIELFVYPGTNDHYFWMLILGFIALFGSGKISFDHLIRSFFLKDQPENSTAWNITLFGFAAIITAIFVPAYQICEMLDLKTLVWVEIFVIGVLATFGTCYKGKCCPHTQTIDSEQE